MSDDEIEQSSADRTPIVALVGDYSSDVLAHRAIPRALELAGAAERTPILWRWIHTSEIHQAARALAGCAAVWLVPASPYASMPGAIAAVRWARESGRPFLGTCGGFQHAVIEFARNAAGLIDADHAESNAEAETQVMTALSCALVEESGMVRFTAGSQLHRAYGNAEALESYHCRYGLNAAFRDPLARAGLIFSGFDDHGEVRAFELSSHPYFIGTLFQPERSALRDEAHPLISAFIRAVMAAALPAEAT